MSIVALRGRQVGDAIVEEQVELKEGDDFYWLDKAASDVDGLIFNAFCPTGPGGGIDNSCSPGGGAGGKVGDIQSMSLGAGKIAAMIDTNMKPGDFVVGIQVKEELGTWSAANDAVKELQKLGVLDQNMKVVMQTHYGEKVGASAPVKIAVPDPPVFLDKAHAEENEAKAIKMKVAAEMGAMLTLEAVDPGASPKLAQYKQQLIQAVQQSQGVKQAPTPQAKPATVKVAPTATGKALGDQMQKEFGLTKLHAEKIAALNPNGLQSQEVFIPRPSISGSMSAEQKAAVMAKHAKMVEWVKANGQPGAVIKAPKGFVSAKAAGVTKTYGDVGTFTTTKGPGEVPSLKVPIGKSPSSGYKPSSTPAGPSQVSDDHSTHFQSLTSGGTHSPEDGKPVSGNDLAWRKGLTNAEKIAISSWKGSSRSIREAVASGEITGEAKAFMWAIEKQAPHQGLVYRGIKGPYAGAIGKQIEDAGIGGTWSDPAPHNTSTAASIGSKKFGDGGTLLRIKTKTGRPTQNQDGYDYEREVVGMPGVTYRIVGIHKNVTMHTTGTYGGKATHLYVADLVEE